MTSAGPRVIGFASGASSGVAAGRITDAAAAEDVIRGIVAEAEQQAGLTVATAHVVLPPAELRSEHFVARVALPAGAVRRSDVTRVMDAASAYAARDGAVPLHVLPVGYDLGYATGVDEPIGLVGDSLELELHTLSVPAPLVENVRLAAERAHLVLGQVIAAPYAAGLAALGADIEPFAHLVLDMGRHSTGVACFDGGVCQFAGVVPLGGDDITRAIARAFDLRHLDAEHLKTLFGSVFGELATHDGSGLPTRHRAEGPTRAELSRVIRDALQMIMTRASGILQSAGLAPERPRVAITGGASQLVGAARFAAQAFDGSPFAAHLATPQGCLEGDITPAHAACIGALDVLTRTAATTRATRSEHAGDWNYVARVGQWLRESF